MIAETSVVVRYVATRDALSFPFPFSVYGEGDVRVTVSVDGRTETVLTPGVDYAVSVLPSGGEVTLAPAVLGGRVPVGATLAVISAVPATQEADFSSTTDVDTQALETQLDRQVRMIQQLQAGLARAVTVPAAWEQSPEERSAALFDAGDAAAQAAAQAERSAREARRSSAETAEIKAAALRELREEGDSQADRLAGLTDNHVLTLEREVERAHGEADRAREEADRAEEAAGQAERMATLAKGVDNLEATWTLPTAVSAGSEVRLPVEYLVGRAALRLNWEGVELFRGVAFEEVGERDEVSRAVRLLIGIPAGNRLNAWVVASNVAGGVREAEEAARESARLAASEAARAETAAAVSGAEADRAAGAAEEARRQAGIAGNLALEATEQADRSEEAADDAERAALKAAAAACVAGRGGIFTLRDPAAVGDAPSGFLILDPALLVPALCALPLTSADSVEDRPEADCFFLLAGAIPCPPCPDDPDGPNGSDNPDEPGEPGAPDNPDTPGEPDKPETPDTPPSGGTLCGKRRKLLNK